MLDKKKRSTLLQKPKLIRYRKVYTDCIFCRRIPHCFFYVPEKEKRNICNDCYIYAKYGILSKL